MSDPRIQGPLSLVAVSVGDALKNRQTRLASTTPQQRNVGRACQGAGLLAGCAYVALFARPLLGVRFAVLVAQFQRTPSDPPAVLVAWIAAAVIGSVYVKLGLRGAQDGPEAGFAAFWSASLPIGSGFLLWRYAPEYLADPLVCGGCFVAVVMCAMRFFLAMRAGRDALALVKTDIAAQEFSWHDKPQRRWW